MLKDIAWKAFESTGNPDAYLLYKNLKTEYSREISPDVVQEHEPISKIKKKRKDFK